MKTSRVQMKLILVAVALTFGVAAPVRAQQRRDPRPKTVRDFFNLLPQKYFPLEGCVRGRDRNCDRARAEYLKTFLEVEDTANGYMKGGCDGAQSCFELALFKRPDGTYVVGLTDSHEESQHTYFLVYAGGAWSDISARVVPEYGENKIYELPRFGTAVAVYANEKVPDGGYRERGRKLYDLVWKGGRFTIKR